MSVLSIGTGLFGLAWLVAIQGDRKQLGLPVWDGTVKSLVVVPPTPVHPSQAEYSATVRGHGYRIPPASSYASHVDSSSATLASSSSRFDCNTFLLLLLLAMILLTALSCSLYLVHQYYVDEALEAQEIECNREKRELRAEISRLEERGADLQDDVRSELMEEQRSLCAKIVGLEVESAALQNEFRSQWSKEKRSLGAEITNLKEENAALQVRSQKRPYNPKIRDLELEISKWEDDFQRRVKEEVKSRVEYKIQELDSIREKNEDVRAENVKLKLIIDGGLPEGGLHPQGGTANVDNISPAPTTASAKAKPHWHQNVGDLQSVRRPPHTPATSSNHPPSSSTVYKPQREAPAAKDPVADSQPAFPDVASATTPITNAEKLALLKEWGVSAPRARKALRETDGDIGDAMQWARDHDDDLGNLAEYDEDDDSTRAAGDTTHSPVQAASTTSSDKDQSVVDKNQPVEKHNDQAAGTSDTPSTSRVDAPSTTHLHHPLPPKPPTPAWLATPKADTAPNPTSQGEKKDGDPARPAQKAGQQSISDALPTTPPHLSSHPTTSHPLPTRIPALTNTLPRPATVPAKPVADGQKLHNPNRGRSEKDEQKVPSGQPTGLPKPTTNRPNVKPNADVVPASPKPVHALPPRPPTAADTFGKSNKATAESNAKTSQPAPPPTSPPPPPPPPPPTTAPQTKDDEACKGTSTKPEKEQAQESTSGANVIQPAPPTTSTPSPPTPPAAPDTNDDAPPKAPPTAAAPIDPITNSADAEAQPTEDKMHDGGADEEEEAGSVDAEKKKRKRRRKKRTGYARPMTAEEWGGRVEGGGEEPAKEWW